MNAPIDWKIIDWKSIDEKKAQHIYADCLAHYKEMLEQMSKTKHKAYALISVMLPIIIAISGYVMHQWNDGSQGIVAYFVVLVLLLYISLLWLVTQVVRSSRGCVGHLYPAQYFNKGQYYTQSLRDIYIGNVGRLDKITTSIHNDLSQMNKATDRVFRCVVFSPIIAYFLTSL